MKKLALILALLFIPCLAFAEGPFTVDAALDAAIDYYDIADRLFIGPDGVYANRLGEVIITGSDLTPVDGVVDGRGLEVAAKEIIASDNGTANTMGIYDIGTTTVLAFWPITDQSTTGGNTYSFGTVIPITFRDLTVTP